MTDRLPSLLVEIAGRRWRVSTSGHDLSLPLSFDGDVPDSQAIYRFVTSFATTVEQVDAFGELIA